MKPPDSFQINRRRLLGMFAALPLTGLRGCSRQGYVGGGGYIRLLREVLAAVRDGQTGVLRDIANTAARSIFARDRLFTWCPLRGGNGTFHPELTPGLPPVGIPLRSVEMAGTVHEGDSLLFTAGSPIVEQALDNGAAGMTVVPPETAAGTHRAIALRLPVRESIAGDTAARVIIPLTSSVLTALLAEIYHRSGGVGRTGDSPPSHAREVLSLIHERLSAADEGPSTPATIGMLIADTVAVGGRILVYDRQHALMKALEAMRPPGWIRPVSAQVIQDGTLTPDDVVIYGALRSNLPFDMMLAGAILEKGANLVVFCPREKDDGGYRLYKETPYALDNGSPEIEGIFRFGSDSRPYVLTSSIINIAFMGAVIEEASVLLGDTRQHT